MYGSLVSFKEHQVKHLTHKKIIFLGEFNAAEIVSISMKIYTFFFSGKRPLDPVYPSFPVKLCTESPISNTDSRGALVRASETLTRARSGRLIP